MKIRLFLVVDEVKNIDVALDVESESVNREIDIVPNNPLKPPQHEILYPQSTFSTVPTYCPSPPTICFSH